jgi:hypothetical protein
LAHGTLILAWSAKVWILHGFITYFKKHILEYVLILLSETLMKWMEFPASIDISFDFDEDGFNYAKYLIMDALHLFAKSTYP